MSQIFIGIDENTSLLYEGSPSLNGHAIWPSPLLSIACHIGPLSDWARGTGVVNLGSAGMVFREDFFDPVARIRRGRLYVRYPGGNPATWNVQRHPAYSSSAQSNMSGPNTVVSPNSNGYVPTRLTTFSSWVATDKFLTNRRDAVLILGFGNRVSIHTVLDVELLTTGEELITIRTRASLGVLPELVKLMVPDQYASLVLEQYEKAANAAFRDDAESVVDRCREAATAALNAERSRVDGFTACGTGKDLGDLATFFSSETFGRKGGRVVLSNAARIIARLHSRAKSAERINNGLSGLSEADAECALALLGIIYRELNWVR